SREGDCPSWRIVSRGRDSAGHTYNLLTMGLDAYGLRQRKHVPQDYKAAPFEARLKLIAGMIDSDGSLSRKGFDWISKYK
ncbi:hypothetical protein QCD71_25005, partial [Sphingomonas sp. PsM26]|nr:hypothetical protein [Sphingomonas sp. PsM26]